MNRENCIEWLTGDKRATCSFSQRKHINRVRKLAEKYPELVEICAENADGTIVAHIPLSALHITIYGAKNSEVCDESDED